MSYSWIGAVVTSIAIPIAFAVLRRIYPVSGGAPVGRSLDDLQREYGRWELLSLPLLFTIVPAASYLWWSLFLALAPSSGFSHIGGSFAVRPAAVIWACPGLLLGILTASAPMNAVYRALLGDRYREFISYQNLRSRFDAERFMTPLYLGGGALAAIAVFLLANWYILFTPTEIRYNPLFGFRERVFDYRDVVAIETAPAYITRNGRTVYRREYAVRFSDSTSWYTNWDPSEASDVQLLSLMLSISEHASVPLTELRVLNLE